MEIPNKIKLLMDALERNGYKAYLVGGCIRDYLLEITPHDYDIFTNATGKEILAIFPSGKVMGGEERQQKILTVIVNGVEISSFRKNGDRTKTGNTLEGHCATCDFTVNSLACGSDGKIIDLEDGQTDINNKVIRTVGNPTHRFKEDKLRVLRGYRFAAKLGFKIDKETKCAMQGFDLTSIKPERIIDEFKKIIATGSPEDFIQQIIFSVPGNLSSVFAFDIYDELSHGKHHSETVLEHLMYSAQICAHITSNFPVVMASLYHDIGKFQTVINQDGHNTFKGHEKKSTEIVSIICDKFKLSSLEKKQITFLVENHMKFHILADMKNITLIKFFEKLEDIELDILDLVALHYSDIQGNMMNPRVKFADFVKKSELYNKYWQLKNSNLPFRLKDMKISGKDLISVGFKPGKIIGDTLKGIYDKVLSGELKNSKPDLIYYVKHNLK